MLPGIQSQLNILSSLEIQLQKAALLDNEKSFFHILETIKRIYKGRIPKEKVKQLLHNHHLSLIASLIAKPAMPKNFNSDDDAPRAKIIYEVLNVIKDAELTVDNFLKVEKIFVVQESTSPTSVEIHIEPTSVTPMPFQTVYEWATVHNIGKIISHPLVQQAMYIDQIHDLFCSGEVNGARDLYIQMKDDLQLKDNRVFHIELAERLFSQGRSKTVYQNSPGSRLPNYVIDKLFTNLLETDHIGLFKIKQPSNSSIDIFEIIKNNIQFVRAQQSLTFKLYDAVATMSKVQIDSNTFALKASELLDDYFDTISGTDKIAQCASDLLAFAFEQWNKQGPTNETYKQERKQIAKYLFEKGARMESIAAHFQQLISIDAGDSELFLYPGVLEPFERLSLTNPEQRHHEQKQLINQAFNAVTTQAPYPMQIPDPIIVKALCKSASSQCFVTNELVSKIALLDPNHVPPIDDSTKQIIALSIRYILENDLIADLDIIQSGTYPLPFNDPNTKLPIDLYQFIMDDKQLRLGFLIAARDEELYANFIMTKSMMSKDPRSKNDTDKLVLPLHQGEHRHTLPNVREYLRKHPEFAATLLGHVDPAELVLHSMPSAKKPHTPPNKESNDSSKR